MAKLTYRDSDDNQIAAYVFEYDSLGRLIRSTEYGANNTTVVQRTEHLYDTYNRLSSQSWVIQGDSFTESYTYNDPTESNTSGDGSLSQMTTATGDTINYNYDALKRLSSTAIKNSSGTTLFRTGYSYKAGTATNQTTNRISVYTTWNPDYTVINSNSYVYDSVGNITQIKDSKNSNRLLAEYTYDVQNQLTQEIIYSYNSSGVATTTTYAYTYDTAGNILTESKNGTVTKTYTYNNSDWRDLLTAYNGTVITYDAIGNPLSYTNGKYSYTMQWEQGRQLSEVEFANGRNQYLVNYSYDLEGIRTSKLVNGVIHNYVTQNGKVVRETIGTGSTAKILDFIYDASGRPFALKYKNGTAAIETFYYVLNLQGDVVALMTADRTIKAQYTYNAWGEVLTATGTMASINPLRYRGYYYDAETGFYYLQSRYYDPTMHRFINADSYASTGQGILGHNMFAYCRNNPVNYADANGQSDVAVTLTGDALAALTAWLSSFAAINWWNPAGWAAAGALALFAVGVYLVADYLYEWFFEENPEYIEVSSADPPDSTSDNLDPGEEPKESESTIPNQRNLPLTGVPNSDSDLLNPDGTVKQKRHYDSNGNPEYDIDYNHGGVGHRFPHRHNWVNGKRLRGIDLEVLHELS